MSDSIAALEEPINNTDFGLSQSLQVAEWKARDINHLRNKTQAFVITQTTARGVQEAQESLRALSNRAALVPADLNGILEEAENYRRPLEVLTQNPVAVDELLAKTKDNLSAVAIATQASLDPESAELLLSDNEAAISGLQLVSNRNLIARQRQIQAQLLKVQSENQARVNNLIKVLDSGETIDYTNPENRKAMDLLYAESINSPSTFAQKFGPTVKIEHLISDTGILPKAYLAHLGVQINSAEDPTEAFDAANTLMYLYNNSLPIRDQLGASQDLLARANAIASSLMLDTTEEKNFTKNTLNNIRSVPPEVQKIREDNLRLSAELGQAKDSKSFLEVAGTPQLLALNHSSAGIMDRIARYLPRPNIGSTLKTFGWLLGRSEFPTSRGDFSDYSILPAEVDYVEGEVIANWNDAVRNQVVYGGQPLGAAREFANSLISAQAGVTGFGRSLYGGVGIVKYPIEKVAQSNTMHIFKSLKNELKNMETDIQLEGLSPRNIMFNYLGNGDYHVFVRDKNYHLTEQVLDNEGNPFVFNALRLPPAPKEEPTLEENEIEDYLDAYF
jgi:hypothetical protein